MTSDDIRLALQLAEASALLAGRQLRNYHKDWRKIVAVAGRDIKVKADSLAEELILTNLKTFSQHPILAEETGWHEGLSQECVWVVDPLDGSANYHQGIPFCVVAIALVVQKQPLLGVIYDFNHDELFSGSLATGALLNGLPIKVSNINLRSEAVLNTGFPARQDYASLEAQDFLPYAQKWRKVRMLGSAALALAYVAAGRADAYRELGTNFWDVAAGIALVKAAGGEVIVKGDVYASTLHVYAHNGQLDD